MGKGSILSLKAIEKAYGEPGSPVTHVLKGIDLDVQPEESLAIVGPSGSGKTTLLNIVGSLDTPSAGQVVFDGRDLAGRSERELAAMRNGEIGFIFQLHHLLPQCTVLENVLVPTLVASDKAGALERARRLLERVGLAQHADSFPARLSGGELQRVAVVRALINKPKLVLADEPTGSLDRDNSGNIAELLADLNREEHVTLLVATHAETLAASMSRSCELRNGKLVE